MTTFHSNGLIKSVPEGWTLGRNKMVFDIIKKKVGARSNEYDLLSLTLGGVKLRDIESGKGKFPAEFDTYQEVMPNDIVFCLFDIDETPRTVGLSSYKGMVTGAYTVARCKEEIDPRYVYYYYLSADYAKKLKPLYTGLRKVIRPSAFLNAPVPIPPYETQKEIADFLDRETAHIDRLIEKKNHFLSILQEKLQSKADDVDEYSAGISRRLRHLIRLNPGKSEVNHLPDDHEVTFLPMEAIDDSFGGINDLAQIRQLKEVNGSYTYFSEGDMLLAKVTPCFENGKKAHAINLKNGVGFGTSELHVLRISHGIIPEYLNLMLSTSRFRAEGCISMTGAGGLKRVSERAILDFKIQLPSEQEQKTIASRIVSEIVPIQEVSQKTNLSIEKLKDLKNSLITEAVTGQLDIQKWQQRGMTDSRLDKIEEDMEQSKRASA